MVVSTLCMLHLFPPASYEARCYSTLVPFELQICPIDRTSIMTVQSGRYPSDIVICIHCFHSLISFISLIVVIIFIHRFHRSHYVISLTVLTVLIHFIHRSHPILR